jgi:acetyl esterase/lipase
MSLAEVDALRANLANRPKNLPIEARRAGFEAMAARGPLPDDLITEQVEIASGLSGLLVLLPDSGKEGVLVWLHGGQFVLGSSTSYRDFAARAAAASGLSVLLPDYRLSPEHVFPAAIEDAGRAIDYTAELGFDMAHVAVGGDSAGGNLAVAAIQARLTVGAEVPAACWLLSPYLDLTHSGASIAERSDRDPFVDPAEMDEVARRYLGTADPHQGSPLFGDVAGFPPTLIQVGSDEALFDDSARFAARLRDAGTTVVFQEWIGMIHVWPLFAAIIEEGRWAHAQAGAFLCRTVFGTHQK